MNIGGRCPLNFVEDKEKFLRTELENFYKKPINGLSIDEMREEFCRNICGNIMC